MVDTRPSRKKILKEEGIIGIAKIHIENLRKRVSNIRENILPGAHASTHGEGGDDELNLGNLPGDVNDIDDSIPAAPTGFDASDIEVKTSVEDDGTTLTWFAVTIPRVDAASGYVISFRKTGTTDFRHIFVEQPDSGNPVAETETVQLDTVYYFKICSVSKLNSYSDWTIEAAKTSGKDTSAPDAPADMTATAIINGVLVEWTKSGESDFSHYEVYRNTVNNSGTATKIADCLMNYFPWKVESGDDYVTQYFWTKAVDRTGNASGFSSVASATPDKIAPVDLQIESRPWVSDIQFTWDEETPDYDEIIWYKKGSPNTDADLLFADGSTDDINYGSHNGVPDGINYFYWDDTQRTGGDLDIQESQTLADAIGKGKGLLAIVEVDEAGSKPPTIIQFNSYLPTIGAGVIAAKAILAKHITTAEAVITDAAQIAGVIIDSNVVQLSALKILIDGEVYLSNWRHGTDATKIDGGNIYTNTVTANQIAANAVTTSELQFDRVTEDPAGEGKLWYRSEASIDQLRFRGTSGKVGYIPRHPLTYKDAPPENLLSNCGFEEDIDGDDFPDFWEDQCTGSGTATRITTDSSYGEACMRLYAPAGTHTARIDQYYIPVDPSTDYYVSAFCKGTGSENCEMRVAWYDRTKTIIGSSEAFFSVSPPGSWTKNSGTLDSPATAAFARIYIPIYNPSSNSTQYWDHIVFSEQRAITPTSEVVAAELSHSSGSVAVPADTWTEMDTITVPNEAHEILFVHVQIVRDINDGRLKGAVRLKINGTYYPTSNGLPIYMSSPSPENSTLIPLPSDHQGETIHLELTVLDADDYFSSMKIWGHSPHKHQ